MPLRRICVVTGSRAEYGLLRWLLQEIADDPDLDLQIVATGMHLAPAFGLTYRDIEADGFAIAAQVEMLLAGDSRTAVAKSVGLGVMGLADAFDRLAPDLVVLLGDRFETFAAAQTAYLQHRPVAHIHGGEITEGALDDALRHAITKLASLHFVAAEPFGDRVRQLGEDPDSIHVVGAMANDAIAALDLPGGAALDQVLDFELGTSVLLVTLHPETQAARDPADDARALLTALDAFPDHRVILTKPNADPGNQAIADRLTDWVAANRERARLYDSLGHRRYLAVLKSVQAVIGNSSSALIEAPALGTPAVNLGDRQKGRPRAASVIDCPVETSAIEAAIAKALSAAFRDQARTAPSPYGGPGAARRIKEVLKHVDLATLGAKVFHDLPAA